MRVWLVSDSSGCAQITGCPRYFSVGAHAIIYIVFEVCNAIVTENFRETIARNSFNLTPFLTGSSSCNVFNEYPRKINYRQLTRGSLVPSMDWPLSQWLSLISRFAASTLRRSWTDPLKFDHLFFSWPVKIRCTLMREHTSEIRYCIKSF